MAFDAQLHDVVPTDSAIVDDNVPRPQCDSIPLLNFKSFCNIGGSGWCGGRVISRRWGDILHGDCTAVVRVDTTRNCSARDRRPGAREFRHKEGVVIMAKSLRSKVKQRYRRAKRHYIEKTVHTERINEAHAKVVKLQQGLAVQAPRPKNAFLYPGDLEAVFAQKEFPRVFDFRSENLPLSGYAVCGSRRAFTDEEKLSLGLVVRSKDGLLDAEKRQLADAQHQVRRSQQRDDSPMATDTEGAAAANDNDEQTLVFTVQSMGLDDGLEEAGVCVPTELEGMQRHQDRISGRTKKRPNVPKVTNALRAKEKK